MVNPTLAAANVGSISTIQVVLLIGVGLSLLWAMVTSFKKMNRAGRIPQPSLYELKAVSEKTRAAARDLEELMTELDQLSHQLHGRLDARITKLESVIKLADERIDRMERLMRSTNNEPTIDVTIEQDEHAAEPAKSAPINELELRHAPIYQMADGGASLADIASELGKPLGEVELILALRKAKSNAGDRLNALQPT